MPLDIDSRLSIQGCFEFGSEIAKITVPSKDIDRLSKNFIDHMLPSSNGEHTQDEDNTRDKLRHFLLSPDDFQLPYQQELKAHLALMQFIINNQVKYKLSANDIKLAYAELYSIDSSTCAPGVIIKTRGASQRLSLKASGESLMTQLMNYRQSIVLGAYQANETLERDSAYHPHFKNDLFITARNSGYGVRPLISQDRYHGHVNEETRQDLLSAAFKERYTAPKIVIFILNCIKDRLEEKDCYRGFDGQEYTEQDYDRIKTLLPILLDAEEAPPSFHELFIMDQDYKIRGINWEFLAHKLVYKLIKYKVFKKNVAYKDIFPASDESIKILAQDVTEVSFSLLLLPAIIVFSENQSEEHLNQLIRLIHNILKQHTEGSRIIAFKRIYALCHGVIGEIGNNDERRLIYKKLMTQEESGVSVLSLLTDNRSGAGDTDIYDILISIDKDAAKGYADINVKDTYTNCRSARIWRESKLTIDNIRWLIRGGISVKEFIALISETKGVDGETGLMYAACYNLGLFKAILTFLSEALNNESNEESRRSIKASIKSLLTTQNKNGDSALFLSIKDSDVDSRIESLLAGIDESLRKSYIDCALGYIKDCWRGYANNLQQNSRNVIADIKNLTAIGLSVDEIAGLMSEITGTNSWTVLMFAARYQPDSFKAILQFLKEIPFKKALKLLGQQKVDGWSVVMLAARYKPDSFIALLQFLTEALNNESTDEGINSIKASIKSLLTTQKQNGQSALFLSIEGAAGIDTEIKSILAGIDEDLSERYQLAKLLSEVRSRWSGCANLIHVIADIKNLTAIGVSADEIIELMAGAKDANGSTIVMRAAYNRQDIKELLQFLTEALNNESNQERKTSIKASIKSLFATAKNKYGKSALFLSIERTGVDTEIENILGGIDESLRKNYIDCALGYIEDQWRRVYALGWEWYCHNLKCDIEKLTAIGASADEITKRLFEIKDNKRWTVIMAAFWKNEELFKRLLQVLKEVSPEKALKALDQQTVDGWSVVLMAACNKPDLFKTLLPFLNEIPFEKALKFLDKQQVNGLSAVTISAEYQPESFKALLQFLTEALNNESNEERKNSIKGSIKSLLTTQNQNGKSVLFLSIEGAGFDKEIENILGGIDESLRKNYIDYALSYIKRHWRNFVNHWHGSSIKIIADINNLTAIGVSAKEIIGIMSEISDKDGWTVMILAARFQPDSFKALFKLLKGSSPTKALMLLEPLGQQKVYDGWSAVMMAARYQPDSFKALLQFLTEALNNESNEERKNSIKASITSLLTSQNQNGKSALFLSIKGVGIDTEVENILGGIDESLRKNYIDCALGYIKDCWRYYANNWQQSSRNIIADIKNLTAIGVSDDEIIELMSEISGNNGWTVMMPAARDNPESFGVLLELLKGVSLTKALKLLGQQKIDGWSAVMLAARYQPDSFNKLLKFLSEIYKRERNFEKKEALKELIKNLVTVENEGNESALLLSVKQNGINTGIKEFLSGIGEGLGRGCIDEAIKITKNKLAQWKLEINGRQPHILCEIVADIASLTSVGASTDEIVQLISERKNRNGDTIVVVAARDPSSTTFSAFLDFLRQNEASANQVLGLLGVDSAEEGHQKTFFTAVKSNIKLRLSNGEVDSAQGMVFYLLNTFKAYPQRKKTLLKYLDKLSEHVRGFITETLEDKHIVILCDFFFHNRLGIKELSKYFRSAAHSGRVGLFSSKDKNDALLLFFVQRLISGDINCVKSICHYLSQEALVNKKTLLALLKFKGGDKQQALLQRLLNSLAEPDVEENSNQKKVAEIMKMLSSRDDIEHEDILKLCISGGKDAIFNQEEAAGSKVFLALLDAKREQHLSAASARVGSS